ncbi:MAG: histidine kinase [Micrococcales bacterium 70-64]|nr:histidine kinase [Leifsonia sp.]ODU64338.1 MAG: histidine kinase [Leifsonia sp. SCN 70-46]OJX86029.1 MAG: histidine kinase [Micrococcales bacterium 70-64]
MADSATAVRALPQNKQPRNPISRKQLEKVLSRSVATFGIVFGAQSLPWLFNQLGEAQPGWLWLVVPGLYGTLLVALVLAVIQIGVKQAQGTFAVLYLIALITWPFFVLPGVEVFAGIHWLNYLITIATGMAAIAFPTVVSTIYLFLAPTIYVVIRATPLGGGAPWPLAVLEGVYALILGSALVIIITMLRQAATSVDNAQATALDRYSHAVRQHATEVERVQVDAIVHDSVLTTFISAARAHTPQAQELAATMAGNAIGYLRDAAAASPDDGTMVRFTALAERITDAAAALSTPFELRVRSVGTRSLPVQASEAIFSAAVQAMVNSIQHGGEGDVSRWVAVRGVAPRGIEVVVGDTGAGFDTSARSERIGVRVSIVERLANAGGRAVIQSAPGEGTIVSLRWPHAPEGGAS